MGIRTFFARILVVMTLVYTVANLIVVSVNYQSRESYWSLFEAYQQSVQWQEAREAVVQLVELEESIPVDRVKMLASLPLPLGCCESERSLVLESLGGDSSDLGANRYRSAAAWEKLLRAQRLSLSKARQEFSSEIAIRNWMIPGLSALALAMVLLISWTILKAKVIAPTEKLAHYVNRLLRGRKSQALDLDGAPSELAALYNAFDLTIGDYRGQLNAQRERVLEMSDESDLLEMQIQSLVEMSERAALILDVSGAVRTWNRRMITLTGVSKNQALRSLFSNDYLDVASQEIFDVAMQTARAGKLPDEFGCVLMLRGRREVRVTIQLSPQVEPGLGVNRILCVVNQERDEAKYDSKSILDENPTLKQSPLIEYLGSLEKGVSEVMVSGLALSEFELQRRQKAFAHTLSWVNANKPTRVDTPIDVTELMTHLVSLLVPKCQEMDIELETELNADKAMCNISAGAMVEIFNALSRNAFDAIQIKGAGKRKVSITSEYRDALFIMQVADSGLGFTDIALEKGFDPFFTTKADQGAFGLGLTHAKYLTEIVGGGLGLNNVRLRQGAIVTLELPVTEANSL